MLYGVFETAVDGRGSLDVAVLFLGDFKHEIVYTGFMFYGERDGTCRFTALGLQESLCLRFRGEG